MNDKKKLKQFVKEIVNTMDEVAPGGWEGTVKAMKKHKDIDNPWALANWMKNKGMKSHKDEEKKQPIGISPDKLKHSECPKCKNKITILKSTDPIVWGCEKCGHNWGWDQVNEEHGDVHYWGKQPTDKQHKISTGYNGTVSLKENAAGNKALRNLVIEATKEVINEYQHEQQHEKKEITQFNLIKIAIDQLIVMHQKGTYDENQELELIRQIKKTVIEIEANHMGTKITANEKVQ